MSLNESAVVGSDGFVGVGQGSGLAGTLPTYSPSALISQGIGMRLWPAQGPDKHLPVAVSNRAP